MAMQARIVAAFSQQCIVCAVLDDLAAVHDDDTVGVADRAEPVRDDDAGARVKNTRQGVLDQHFGGRIDARGCLVEHQHALGTERHRPRQRQQLALPD